MKTYRYVTLDPTGNLTCLVTDPVDPEDEAVLTRTLLAQCEQVAYLEPPERQETVAGIRLMGGEFCGNAAMASAAWLIRDELEQGETKTFLLGVSGTSNPVRCTVRKTADGFEGTVEMPGVQEIGEKTFFGIPFTVVRLEGIVHLICENGNLEKDRAEELIRKIAPLLPDEAVGLLQWDSRTQYLTPLVYVRENGSLVWEHGCGSGSAAVGAAEAFRNGAKMLTVCVDQPGGRIRVTAGCENGTVTKVSITGQIHIGEESRIAVSSCP